MVEIAFLQALPDPVELKRRSRALAILDRIFTAFVDSDLRKFRFIERWRDGESLAAMENGGGDDYSIVFTADGVYLRGFDHECMMNIYGQTATNEYWPGLTDGLPEQFQRFIREPEFTLDGDPLLTVCLWRRPTDESWQLSRTLTYPENDPSEDGSEWLLSNLTEWTVAEVSGNLESYHELSGPPDAEALSAIMGGDALTADLVYRLNPDADIDGVVAEARIAGYPVDPALHMS